MKLLFIARHFTYFRNYDGALRELAARGHHIHLAVEIEKEREAEGRAVAETLAREYPERITYGKLPRPGARIKNAIARRLRLGYDYLRYLDTFYDTAPLRRVRARDRTPLILRVLGNPVVLGGPGWRRRVRRLLHAMDKAVSPPRATSEYLRAQDPDALVITPLVDLGSRQIDYVRAAKELRIPTALAVWSWDHLSSKALLRDHPDRVFVWNETQRREAIDEHGVPSDRVVVTGAQCFDHWFTRRPSRSREEFCAQLKLPVDGPLILYVATGLIVGSPPEPPFVREWLQALRRSGDLVLAEASVLIRPHPSQADVWRGVDLREFGPVAVWGGNPVDETSRADYFDSLFHSAAVVGLNTSAFIEAGIVGREVLTILPARFHDNQEGTVHFRYLLQIGGGLLRVARDLDAHVAQLAEALRREPGSDHPHRAFLERFVRPRGLEQPATPAFVAAVEELPACRVEVPSRVTPVRLPSSARQGRATAGPRQSVPATAAARDGGKPDTTY